MRSSWRTMVVAIVVTGCGSNTRPGSSTLDLGLEMQAQIGFEFVQQRGCPTCHQSMHAGDGTLSGSISPAMGSKSAYAGNLTPDVATGIGGWADIEIVRAMRFGVDNEGQPLCPPMAHYDGTQANVPAMTDVEAMAIVAYLRALPPVTRAIPESKCPPIKPAPSDMGSP